MATSRSRMTRLKAAPPKRRKASKPGKSKGLRKVKKVASGAVKQATLKPAPGTSRAPKPLPGIRRTLRRRPAPQPRPAPGLGLTKKLIANAFETDLDRTPANYQPLTPLSFLARAALAHPDVVAIIHGKSRTSYAEFYARSRRLASALANEGIGRGDTVSVLLANTPPMLEDHPGVTMTCGVLHALTTRLDAASIAFMLDHGEAKIFIVDREFAKTAQAALALAKVKPMLIAYDDREFPQTGELEGAIDYETF